MPSDSSTLSTRIGVRTLAVVTAFYSACIAIATYPVVKTFSSALPSTIDSMAHLWTMRWYKTCLIQGRSPFLCPDVQYPVGVPLGFYPPMHIQSLIYLPLSSFIKNDVLCYNIIWFASLVFSGLGVFVLAHRLVKNTAAAALGGMLAMIGTPILMHAHGHLEMIQVGFFPLFLALWMDLIDAPSKGRLAGAVGLYLLTAMSAPYYFLFAAFPAGLYVAYRLVAERRDARAWIKARLGWLIAFCLIVGPVLLVLFSSQLWTATHGFPMARPKSQFESYGAPWWSYLVPTGLHPLGQAMPVDVYRLTGLSGECFSYLGIVTLFLINHAAVKRTRFAKSGFMWLTFAMLVVLSLGAKWRFGTMSGTLPASWLRAVLPPFRVIRVPARFNIFAGVCAGVIAAAGAASVLESVKTRRRRNLLFAGLLLVGLWDLSTVPFGTETLPKMPLCYEEMLKRDPSAAFLDAPHFGYAGAHLFPSACGYWQSLHGGKTSSGYSAGTNTPGDQLATWSNPFFLGYLVNPGYVTDPESVQVDIVGGAHFLDYTWLYLHEHNFRYVVLHRWPGAWGTYPVKLEGVMSHLAPFKAYEDADTLVYDRDRMKPPTHPAVLPTRGWLQKVSWHAMDVRPTAKVAKLVVFNPDAGRDLLMAMSAVAFREARNVRLLHGDTEIARWTVGRDDFGHYATKPFRLPAGRSELTLESDGELPPASHLQQLSEGDQTPYSLRVVGLVLRNAATETR